MFLSRRWVWSWRFSRWAWQEYWSPSGSMHVRWYGPLSVWTTHLGPVRDPFHETL